MTSECVHRHPEQDVLDIDEQDDGSTEFEIVSLTLYDKSPCTICRETRLWYHIGYRAEHRQIRTHWGVNLYLKDENCIAHAGFSLGRLLTFVSIYANENGQLNVQKARRVVFARAGEQDFALQGLIDGQCVPLERLAAVPPAPAAVPLAAAIATPAVVLPAPAEVPPAGILDGTLIVNVDEDEQQQQNQFANFPAQQQQHQPPPPPPLISLVAQQVVNNLLAVFPPFFVNPPFPRLPLTLPPLQFGQQQQQQTFAPPPAPTLQIEPVPTPQPLCDVAPSCSRRVPRECTRAAYKLLSPDQIKAAGQILFGNSRPDSTMSSCSSASASSSSSASSSALSRASSSSKHTERDKKMRMIVEYWKQKCVPNCPHC
ncbi:hypothetical protein niasHT_031241 [Heterodera trifolii]|uniref:Uncharacterized protein n=1 Tax=Heterodera trifolii TaxID=157864 RepID=A0ABD2I9C2_9BILA